MQVRKIMKKELILLGCLFTSGSFGIQISPNTFNRMFGANSPIFNLPLYYSTDHFEYDQVNYTERTCKDSHTKKCIIQSKTMTPQQRTVKVVRKRKRKH